MSLPHCYSIVIAVYPDALAPSDNEATADWRLGDITVDWVDFTRTKSADAMPAPASASHSPAGPAQRRKARPHEPTRHVPGSAPSSSGPARPSSPTSLSLQPLLAHLPLAEQPAPPSPLSGTPSASGITDVGRGIVHLFKHAPPASVVARLDGGGESSASAAAEGEWAGERAEGEDGSLVAVLAVPAWMRPSDFLEFIGGWAVGLEGVRMIREATTPNRSIVLLKFRDPLQASDFMVIFTGRAFSTLDARETCHPIRIHHLVLHKAEDGVDTVAVPAFPPAVYASRQRARLPHGSTDGAGPATLDALIPGTEHGRHELPTCPVCLERLDSTVTGLVTLPCAHTFDCDCLRKWGDSRCPVCRVSHLLLSGPGAGATAALAKTPSGGAGPPGEAAGAAAKDGTAAGRLPQCAQCAQQAGAWMCVVCGAVGCGRYAPGQAHARMHWEATGHGLAMELETQRVWDYGGDNYVHRLIRSRTDGKLVELPAASSLVTPAGRPMPLGGARALGPAGPPGSAGATPRHSPASSIHATPSRAEGASQNSSAAPAHDPATPAAAAAPASPNAGPSATDVDKMSTIEAITLEYSYLLSSQLEAMRAHYEAQLSSTHAKVADLSAAEAEVHGLRKALDDARRGRGEADTARQRAEAERDRAEDKARRAGDVARALQRQLGDERAMSRGLEERVGALGREAAASRARADAGDAERRELEDTVRDLMFTLDAGSKVREDGVDGAGGDLVVVPKPAKGKRRVRGG